MAKTKTKEQTKPFDFILFIVVLLLLALGIVMVLSASSPSALSITGSSYTYVKKQAIAAVLGIIIMLILSKIDYHKYEKFYKISYYISVLILLLVLVPGLGRVINGARRWLNVPILTSVQPSEITKIGLILFYAVYLTKNQEKLKIFKNGFIIPFLWVAPIVLILIFVQDHLSATIIMLLLTSIMMLMAGTRLLYFLTIGLTGGVGLLGGIFILAKYFNIGAFRIARLTAFINPWADSQGSGWQIIQSLYAIGSGGLFGVGLGESTQKYLYISEPHNDFIFAVLAEELGFIGCLTVILLFAVFIWRGILIAMKAKDMFGSLFAVRNNCINRLTSNNKYSGCYIINASNRNATAIF